MTPTAPSPHFSHQPLDRPLLELLRSEGPLEIDDLTVALKVTATAVRPPSR